VVNPNHPPTNTTTTQSHGNSLHALADPLLYDVEMEHLTSEMTSFLSRSCRLLRDALLPQRALSSPRRLDRDILQMTRSLSTIGYTRKEGRGMPHGSAWLGLQRIIRARFPDAFGCPHRRLNDDSRYLYLIASRPTANILSSSSSDTTEHYRVGGSCTHPYPACNKHGGLRKPTTQCLELFYHLLIMEVIEDSLLTWVATTLPVASNCCRHPS
jgi:hypothetical protein